jgi:putative oxidoreductase
MIESRMTRFMNWRGHGWFALPARWYLGAVFLLACWHKLWHPELFALDVATYQFLPLALINIFAITLPWVELGAGIMLVLGFRSRSASLLVALMMVAFMIALAFALDRGLDMSCGCFASSTVANEDPISWMTLVRDAVWLGLALYVLVFDRCSIGVDRLLAMRRPGVQQQTKQMETA